MDFSHVFGAFCFICFMMAALTLAEKLLWW